MAGRAPFGGRAEALVQELRFTREPKAKTLEAEYLDGRRLFDVINAFIEGIPVAPVVVGKGERPGEFRMEDLPRGNPVQFYCIDVQRSQLTARRSNGRAAANSGLPLEAASE